MMMQKQPETFALIRDSRKFPSVNWNNIDDPF